MRFVCADTTLDIEPARCIVAGWTGRDATAIQHHIDELAALGVKPPSSVPLYYRVSAGLLTQAGSIQVAGDGTSGEVEPLLLLSEKGCYLGLASDHTDRSLETHSVALSKQICAKPVAEEIWPFEEVKDHLDQIELRSWIREAGDLAEEGEWVPYQQGTLAAIRPLSELIDGSGILRTVAETGAAAMLCGTFGVLSGGVRPARGFRMEMVDKVLRRTISHAYDTIELPIIA